MNEPTSGPRRRSDQTGARAPREIGQAGSRAASRRPGLTQQGALAKPEARPFDQVPPQSMEMEQCVLGAMILDADAIAAATELLTADDFYYTPEHSRVFETIVELYDAGQPVDMVTVAERLRGQGHLQEAGGAAYIDTLVRAVPAAGNIRAYARVVQEKSILRRLQNAAYQIGAMVHDGAGEVPDVVNRAEHLLFSVAASLLRGDFTPVRDTTRDTYRKIEERFEQKRLVVGVPTGFRDLDRITAGLQRNDLVVLAARPAMGKTSLAVNMAYHAAVKEKVPVAIFSLEMSREQLVEAMLSCAAGVDGHRMRTGFMNSQDWEALAGAVAQLYEAPIWVDDTPGVGALEMRAKARRLASRGQVGMIIVDYLQLVSYHRPVESRNVEMTYIARAMKEMARELKVPVVALSQLSRAVEKEDRRPILSDLRDSGAIEAEADVVAFIHRKDRAKSRVSDQEEGDGAAKETYEAQIIIAKNRNGPTGELMLMFHPRYRRFASVESRRGD